MEVEYIPSLIFLSVAVAILASYVALNLAYSVTQAKGRSQAIWLTCGSIAMGVGIWSMHFNGMLAFQMPGMEMAYDVPLMILSVVVAVIASALALFVVSRPTVLIGSLISGGIAMAAAIAGMHYIGMFSMRMQAHIHWNVYLVLASIAIALVTSFVALAISVKLRDRPERLSLLILASVIMGVAIAGMHYTGMAAATFIHDETAKIETSNLLVSSGLTFAVISTTLTILGLALVSSMGQRLIALKTRRAEALASSSEEKFRRLVEAVEDYAIFGLDPKGFVTSWNSGAEKITGYTEKEIIGKHISILSHQEDKASGVTADELEIAEKLGSFKDETLRVRKDGTQFYANIVISPLRDKDKKLTGFSKVIRDVTQLKEAEQSLRNVNEQLEKRVQERTLALEDRESQLRTMTNAMPVLLAQLDKKEKVLFANDFFCDWFGHVSGEMTGLTLEEVLGDVYLANKPFIDKALHGETVSYERESKSGSKQAILNITYVPEFDRQRKVKGFVVVATDVTRYKEIQAELKTAKEAAEVANETKSAFLANMSHEIRTPLGVVLGFSELLLNHDISSSERVNGMEIIKRNGHLLSTIINDILDLSKVEAGKLEIEKVDVSFTEIMAEVGSLLNLEASEKGIHLTVVSEGPMPAMIKTDPLRLRQILFNIVGNAIKFTEKGSVEVRVKISSHEGKNKLSFVVKDTGEGIDPEKAERLFTPFTQADPSTTRRFGGTGLGLVLSKKLAQALGGDVTLVKSEYGVGSTFCVTIDPGVNEEVLFKSSDSPRPERNLATLLQLPEIQRGLTDFRILLVDDSPDNQILIKKILSLEGAEVETAANGREGVEKAMAGNFSLVLMDLQMPGMDGYDAIRALRKKGFNRPVIALTAHAMKEERKKCLASGFDDHLTKPIDRESLLRALTQYTA